jgi:hypothetical protein
VDAKVSFLFDHRPNSHIDVANIQTATKFSHQKRAGGISMKIILSSRGLFVIGFVVLVATNIVVLSGVASNRSGNPETLTTLTERELHLPYRIYKENSGFTLRLDWRVLSKDEDDTVYSRWRSPAWFSAEKLQGLGFNTDDYLSSEKNATNFRQPISKGVFIVLENNGDLYREAVKRAEKAIEMEEVSLKLNLGDKRLISSVERAERQLKRVQIEESRLFAIDAGLDPKKLRIKYEDRARFIIVKGQVKPSWRHDKEKKEVLGVITQLSVSSIHVPLKYRNVSDTILAQDKPMKNEFQSSRYEVELAFGRRLEPWIVSVHLLDDKSN